MWIEMQPFDTFFFRDNKPFQMGEENTAAGIFPPFPSTLYGALRSSLLSDQPNLIREGKTETSEDFTRQIEFERLALRHERTGKDGKNRVDLLFPLPRDILRAQDGAGELVELSPGERDFPGSGDGEWVLSIPEKHQGRVFKYPGGNYISGKYLKKYLTDGKISDGTRVYPETDFLYREGKTGIARSKSTRTARRGHIYRADYLKFHDPVSGKNTSFLAKVKGLPEGEPAETRYLKVGAEGRPSFWRALEKEPDDVFECGADEVLKGVFRLYLATPGIFGEQGEELLPFPRASGNQVEFEGHRFEFLTAALNGTRVFSGFDLKAGSVRPSYQAVLPGSVYYFRSETGIPRQLFHGARVSQVGREKGFGLFLAGNMNQN